MTPDEYKLSVPDHMNAQDKQEFKICFSCKREFPKDEMTESFFTEKGNTREIYYCNQEKCN